VFLNIKNIFSKIKNIFSKKKIKNNSYSSSPTVTITAFISKGKGCLEVSLVVIREIIITQNIARPNCDSEKFDMKHRAVNIRVNFSDPRTRNRINSGVCLLPRSIETSVA
jgi:hypothetical protein